MTEEEFKYYQGIFLLRISESDLEDSMGVIDGESIISRVYKKVGNEIPDTILSYYIVYNKHIVDEQYESAISFREILLKTF